MCYSLWVRKGQTRPATEQGVTHPFPEMLMDVHLLGPYEVVFPRICICSKRQKEPVPMLKRKCSVNLKRGERRKGNWAEGNDPSAMMPLGIGETAAWYA